MLVLVSNQSSSSFSLLITIFVALISGVTASLLTGIFTLISGNRSRETEEKIAKLKTTSELVYSNEIKNLDRLQKYSIRLVEDTNEYSFRLDDPDEFAKLIGDAKEYNQRMKMLSRAIQEDIAMVKFSLASTTNNQYTDKVILSSEAVLNFMVEILGTKNNDIAYSKQVALRKECKKLLNIIRDYTNEQLKLLPRKVNEFIK